MITSLLRRAGLTAVVASSVLLAACGGGGGSGSQTTSGQLRISLTDSQSCNYESVFVTVNQVRVHRSADPVADDDAGWIPLTLNPPRQVDLMTLRNGTFVELGTMPLEAGTYSQVRLVLASNGASAPFANYLVLPGAPTQEIALKTPSAQQSGLKLNVQATVEPGQIADLVLDFDPCKSVVKAGNSGNYNLKPVITAYVDLIETIQGFTVPGALVSAQQNGTSVKTTVAADGTGRFVLWPLAAGTYDLVITAPGYATAVLEGVQVVDGATEVSSAPLALTPEATLPATLAGAVTVTGATEVYADVRALQSYGAAPRTIEVAATPVNAVGGGYSFTLPTAAPVRSVWTSSTVSYTFATNADTTAAAGKYRVEATAAGFALPQVLPLPPAAPYDLLLGDVTGANFTFTAP